MKKLITALVTSIFALTSLSSFANTDKQKLLKELDQIQITTYETTAAIFSYTLEDNKNAFISTQYHANNKTALMQGTQAAASIDASLAALNVKLQTPIQPLWDAYQHILLNEQIPIVAPGGVIDTFQVAELLKARNALNTALDAARKQVETGISEAQVIASAQARRVKEIAMVYTARLAGVPVAVDSKFDVAGQAQVTSTMFEALAKSVAENATQSKLVTTANAQWDFVKPALSADKKIAAPVVINNYTSEIVKEMQQIQ